MDKEIDENDSFSAALKSVTDKLGRGCQTSLSIDTGLEAGYISQLKTGKRKASVKTQIKIAKSLGYRHIEFLSLGESILTGQRTDIVLRDLEEVRRRQPFAGEVSEQSSAYNKVDKYKVIAEVGEILDSGNTDIITALVKNVQEFKRAVVTSKRLNICEEELKTQRKEIDDLRNQVARLTAPPTTAKRSEVSSVNRGT